jgi:hypothetical protein
MANEQGREKCLEVLGLEPTASAEEFKAAYRDLAKVWHPDRFTHDPRLQQKAQEKLKEINDAYRRLLDGTTSTRSRRTPHDAGATRDTNPARDWRRDAARAARADAYDSPRESAPHARRKNLWLALAPVVVACATFAFVTPRLISSRSAAPTHEVAADAAQTPRDQPSNETQPTTDDGAAQKIQRAERQTGGAARADTDAADKPTELSTTPPTRALPTVSVVIDPTTNLRARADCPHKLTATFPAGDEPRAYCDADHKRVEAGETAAGENHADKSRLKSLAGRLASPSKWFSDKPSPDAPAKKSATQEQNRDEN